MTELAKRKRGRPPKVKTTEEVPLLSSYQKRAKKAWATRRAKKVIFGNNISTDEIKDVDEIKDAIETTKSDIYIALKRLTDMGLNVIGVGIKSTRNSLECDNITIKFQI